MKRIFTTFAFTQVQKSEFKGLVKSIISVVGTYDTTALLVDGMYGVLVE